MLKFQIIIKPFRLKFLFFKIEGELLYNVVLVSAIQQLESGISTCT